MATGCFVSTGRTLGQALERVALADSLGYEAVYTTHTAGRDSLTVLAAYAQSTEKIKLGTGVVPIYTRTPATMAQTAVTLDELSEGRMRLGIGVSHRPVVEAWHGQTIDRPVSEMREYVSILRAMFAGENPPEGEKWKTSFHLHGVPVRSELPIYIAALSPAMLRLAGEVADGVILWLCNPSYIERVVVPELAEGASRAGREPGAIDIVAAVPSALTDDRGPIYEAMRRDLLTYFSLPFYRAMIERSGFTADIEAFDGAGGDPHKMQSAISDAFLEDLLAVGSAAEVQAGVQRYASAGAASPCIGPIPGSDFDATLRAVAS